MNENGVANGTPMAGVDLLTLQAALEMLQKAGLIPKPDPRDNRTVKEIVSMYLPSAQRNDGPRTFDNKSRALADFCAAFGERKVNECNTCQLEDWIHSNSQRWQSLWTRSRIIANVQACFNWAVRRKLIKENPFVGVKRKRGGSRRPMLEEEFRLLVRSAYDASFRRAMYFMFWTGSRTGEMASLRWSDINWENNTATLDKHKTAEKTGKPRVIFLLPVVVRMLRWMQKNPIHGTTAKRLRSLLLTQGQAIERPDGRVAYRLPLKKAWNWFRQHGGITRNMMVRGRGTAGVRIISVPGGPIQRWAVYRLTDPAYASTQANRTPLHRAIFQILSQAPMIRRELLNRMKKKGYGIQTIYRAIRELKGKPKQKGDHCGRKHKSTQFYEMVVSADSQAPGQETDFVFPNSWGQPWKAAAISLRLTTMREATGVRKDCSLYSLRHAFICNALKNGANLKLVSLLAGHASVTMTEHYCRYLDQETDALHKALLQAFQPGPNVS